MTKLNASLKTSEKELGSLRGQVGSLTEQMATQKAANDLLQSKFDEEKAAHIRAESRIESLNIELNKKNEALLGVSLDIENYCTLRLFFDLSTLAGLSRRNLPEAGIRLLFQI